MTTSFVEPLSTNLESYVEDDRFLVRYAWMAGPPINIAAWTGSRGVGEFSDDRIPNMTLIRLPDARPLGPYEVPAVIIQGDSVGSESSPLSAIAAPVSSTPNPLQRNEGSRLTRFNNSPKQVAYLLMRTFESSGLCLFEHVKGENFDEVKRAYKLVFPGMEALRGEFDFTAERTKMGQIVRGPFLDEVREYLKVGGVAAERLKQMQAPEKRKVPVEILKNAVSMLREMRGATERAWAHYLVKLNGSEREIRRFRDGKPGKADYDQVDERFINNVRPIDIEAMAHTNRTPLDLQQLEAGQAMAATQSDTMMKGFRDLVGKLGQGPSVTMEDIEKLLADREAKRDAWWREELRKLGVLPEEPNPSPE